MLECTMSGAQSYTNKMPEKLLGKANNCQDERSSLGMKKSKSSFASLYK